MDRSQTVVGNLALTGDDIVIAPEENWVITRGMEQLYIKAEMLYYSGTNMALKIEKAMSREGPWTTVLTVNTAYTVGEISLSAEFDTTAGQELESYLRWHIDANDSSWSTCFRITSRQWP
jgi:hypothetical protein